MNEQGAVDQNWKFVSKKDIYPTKKKKKKEKTKEEMLTSIADL